MTSPVIAALTTLRANRFEIFCAKLFGVKRICEDSGCTVTIHYWRGKYYMTDCKENQND